jgi:dynein assembly factor 2
MERGGGELKDISQEEISKLTRAMKDKTFQSHLDEYTKEISDPAHRKEYLQYLDQLEAKGEMPDGQVLLRTEPGCCVKTSIGFKNGQIQKCFINIVHSDLLEDMSEVADEKGAGKRVQLPYSLGPPRPERDNKDQNCMTADFAVSTWTFGQAIQRPQILKMLVDTATEGLQGQFFKGHEEVKKDFKVMRRIRCRGPGARPIPMSVKGELLKNKGKSKRPQMSSVSEKSAVTPSELREMRREAKEKQLKPSKPQDDDVEEVPTKVQEPVESSFTASGAPRIRVPKHKLIHSGAYNLTDFMEASNRPTVLAQSVPRLLKLIVELPSVKKVGEISLDVTSTNICIEVPDKYYLDLPLSYEIDEDKGDAKFDKVKQTLTLELPVKPKPPDPNLLANTHGIMSEGEAEGDDGDDDAVSESRGHEEDPEEDLPPLEDPSEAECIAVEKEPPAMAAPPQPQPQPERQAPQSTAPQDLVPEDEMLPFIASDSFVGKRQGYYFGKGEEGLGYFRDRRQRRPARETLAEPTPAPKEVRFTPEKRTMEADVDKENEAPLIEEIDEQEFIPASASKPGSEKRAPLPHKVQQYLDTAALLSSRVASANIEESRGNVEPSFEWHQTRQNFLLFIDILVGHEVAGLQLSVVGRRLSIIFCTRPVNSGTWCQQRLRRTLCRGVDARQWHAEFPSLETRSHSDKSQLVIVLRKTEQGEKWLEAFDTSVVTDTREPMIIESDESAEIAGTDAARKAIAEKGVVTMHGTADTAAGTDVEMVVEDSAELDIAAPAPEQGGGSAAPTPTTPWNALATNAAANAAAQSAMVMGQAVLLKTRLMYQLF